MDIIQSDNDTKAMVEVKREEDSTHISTINSYNDSSLKNDNLSETNVPTSNTTFEDTVKMEMLSDHYDDATVKLERLLSSDSAAMTFIHSNAYNYSAVKDIECGNVDTSHSEVKNLKSDNIPKSDFQHADVIVKTEDNLKVESLFKGLIGTKLSFFGIESDMKHFPGTDVCVKTEISFVTNSQLDVKVKRETDTSSEIILSSTDADVKIGGNDMIKTQIEMSSRCVNRERESHSVNSDDPGSVVSYDETISPDGTESQVLTSVESENESLSALVDSQRTYVWTLLEKCGFYSDVVTESSVSKILDMLNDKIPLTEEKLSTLLGIEPLTQANGTSNMDVCDLSVKENFEIEIDVDETNCDEFQATGNFEKKISNEIVGRYSTQQGSSDHLVNQANSLTKAHKKKKVCKSSKRHRATKSVQKSNNMREKRFRCETCGKSFSFKTGLSKHTKTHKKEKLYTKTICGKILSRNKQLKAQLKTHNGKKQHHCSICGMSFSVKYDLLRHNKTHSGVKPNLCAVCGKSFTRNEHLRTHMRMCEGGEPVKCTACGKNLCSERALQIHMRIHSGEKPYLCNLCGKSFAHNVSLRRHERTHSGEKPYPCTTCEKSFTQSSHLKNHLRTHSGETKYQCAICGKSYSVNSSLKRHIMKIHAGKEKL